MTYRGYTIEADYFGYKYFKTSDGIDCSYENEGWKSNVKNTETITSAQLEIDEIIAEEDDELVWRILGFVTPAPECGKCKMLGRLAPCDEHFIQ